MTVVGLRAEGLGIGPWVMLVGPRAAGLGIGHRLREFALPRPNPQARCPDGQTTVAVKVTDMLGEEVLVTTEV